jgi:exodeoxyribonuclease VII large subunit
MESSSRQVLKPAQLNALARDLLEGSFPMIWVEGEISNFTRPSSGHVYFTLKDDRAQVRCALFKMKAQYLRFMPREGMLVQVRGRLTLYEARGDYQLVLDYMEESGEGALRRALEILKQKLQTEGLFDVSRKRELPAYIKRLGVITSPTGAAVRDVLSVLQRRFPLVAVDVLPVPVQGEGAAADIVQMLKRAIDSERYDALLITRGGGSLEDLWCFNDEQLTRAVAASPIPIVSAVGHEIDTTLVDFAADLRAPTPSAAAELLVPNTESVSDQIEQLLLRLQRNIQRQLENTAQHLDRKFLRLRNQQPQMQFDRLNNRLSQAHAKFAGVMRERLQAMNFKIKTTGLRIEHLQPSRLIEQRREQSNTLQQRMQQALLRRLELSTQQLRQTGRALNAVSPLATLDRGYSILRDQQGHVITNVSQVQNDQELNARLAEGSLKLSVISKED